MAYANPERARQRRHELYLKHKSEGYSREYDYSEVAKKRAEHAATLTPVELTPTSIEERHRQWLELGDIGVQFLKRLSQCLNRKDG